MPQILQAVNVHKLDIGPKCVEVKFLQKYSKKKMMEIQIMSSWWETHRKICSVENMFENDWRKSSIQSGYWC